LTLSTIVAVTIVALTDGKHPKGDNCKTENDLPGHRQGLARDPERRERRCWEALAGTPLETLPTLAATDDIARLLHVRCPAARLVPDLAC
jgi:hypothetical protein